MSAHGRGSKQTRRRSGATDHLPPSLRCEQATSSLPPLCPSPSSPLASTAAALVHEQLTKMALAAAIDFTPERQQASGDPSTLLSYAVLPELSPVLFPAPSPTASTAVENKHGATQRNSGAAMNKLVSIASNTSIASTLSRSSSTSQLVEFDAQCPHVLCRSDTPPLRLHEEDENEVEEERSCSPLNRMDPANSADTYELEQQLRALKPILQVCLQAAGASAAQELCGGAAAIAEPVEVRAAASCFDDVTHSVSQLQQPVALSPSWCKLSQLDWTPLRQPLLISRSVSPPRPSAALNHRQAAAVKRQPTARDSLNGLESLQLRQEQKPRLLPPLPMPPASRYPPPVLLDDSTPLLLSINNADAPRSAAVMSPPPMSAAAAVLKPRRGAREPRVFRFSVEERAASNETADMTHLPLPLLYAALENQLDEVSKSIRNDGFSSPRGFFSPSSLAAHLTQLLQLLTFGRDSQSAETVGELERVEAQQGFRVNVFNEALLPVELYRVRAELHSEATGRLLPLLLKLLLFLQPRSGRADSAPTAETRAVVQCMELSMRVLLEFVSFSQYRCSALGVASLTFAAVEAKGGGADASAAFPRVNAGQLTAECNAEEDALEHFGQAQEAAHASLIFQVLTTLLEGFLGPAEVETATTNASSSPAPLIKSRYAPNPLLLELLALLLRSMTVVPASLQASALCSARLRAVPAQGEQVAGAHCLCGTEAGLILFAQAQAHRHALNLLRYFVDEALNAPAATLVVEVLIAVAAANEALLEARTTSMPPPQQAKEQEDVMQSMQRFLHVQCWPLLTKIARVAITSAALRDACWTALRTLANKHHSY